MSPTHRTTRLLRRAITAAVGATVALVLSACSTAAPATTNASSDLSIPDLRVGYVASGILGGAEGYGLAHGNFKQDLADSGIASVSTTPFSSGSQAVVQALIGGSIDIGFLGNTAYLTAKANGQDLVLLNETLVGLDLWIISGPNGPKTLNDLNGAKIAIPFGDIQERVGKEIVERSGLQNVQWVNVPPTGQAEAIANGAADAAVVIARGTWARLESQGYPVVTKVSESFPDLVGASVTVTTQQFLDAHPGFTDAYEKARSNSVKLIQSNVDAYNAFQADEFRGGSVTPEEEAVYYPADRFQLTPFTDAGLALLREELDWLVKNGAAKNDFDIDQSLATYSQNNAESR